jgi:hypothetical protein
MQLRIDAQHRTDEVNADVLLRSNAQDVIPQLLAFLLCPAIGALINRDDELGDRAQGLEELGFCGFHFSSALAKERPKQTCFEFFCLDRKCGKSTADFDFNRIKTCGNF